MKHGAALVLGVCLAGGYASACSCSDGGPFLEVARGAPLIVRGVVVTHADHGLDFEVREIYKGRETRRTVRVWGDNGLMCRRYASALPDNTEWVLALYPAVSGNEVPYKQEKATDYQIISCGEFAVRVDDGFVATRDASGSPLRVSIRDLAVVLGSR